jgi:hypothetical protein
VAKRPSHHLRQLFSLAGFAVGKVFVSSRAEACYNERKILNLPNKNVGSTAAKKGSQLHFMTGKPCAKESV